MNLCSILKNFKEEINRCVNIKITSPQVDLHRGISASVFSTSPCTY